MSKLTKLNFCLEDGKGIFTIEQLKRINYSLIKLPLAIADAAYEIDDYISELFYVVLSRYYNLSPSEKASVAATCIKNLFITNIRAKQVQFKYSYAIRLIAESDHNRFAASNDYVVLYSHFKNSNNLEVVKYIDEIVHILLYEDKPVKKKDISTRLNISPYKLRKLQSEIRGAYE
jgi:hypothetical protein